MAKKKMKTAVNPCQDQYKKDLEKKRELLRKTTDEELGKMYRLRYEASEFIRERGIY